MTLPLIVALAFLWFGSKAIYRLYWHPLSHIPGPKRAAISHLYEFYYDVIRGGTYLFEVEKMHQKYGTASFVLERTTRLRSIFLNFRPDCTNQPPGGPYQ